MKKVFEKIGEWGRFLFAAVKRRIRVIFDGHTKRDSKKILINYIKRHRRAFDESRLLELLKRHRRAFDEGRLLELLKS